VQASNCLGFVSDAPLTPQANVAGYPQRTWVHVLQDCDERYRNVNDDALKEGATGTSAPLAPSTEALLRELRTFLPSSHTKFKGKQHPRNSYPTPFL
jgi:hypothetical protein